NTFENNYAGWYGGGVFCRVACSPEIHYNIFQGNRCSYLGSGVYLADNSNANITHNYYAGNPCDSSYGGVIYEFVNLSPVIACNIFVDNSNSETNTSNAAVRTAANSTGLILNNLITQQKLMNPVSVEGVIYIGAGGHDIVMNNIIYNNGPIGIYTIVGATPAIGYNNTWNNTSGNYGGALSDLTGINGNISADPNIAPTLPAPFTLHELNPGSPCINTGDNTVLPPGLTADFDGDNRVIGATVDMGPQEFHAITVPDDLTTIQAAINTANSDDEIVVRCGVYLENINFSGKNIRLRSLNPLDNSFVQHTIIDGGENDSCVKLISGEDETAALAGFRLQNGHGEFGGGVHVGNFSSPVVMYNYITNCMADRYGGGIDNRDDSQGSFLYNTVVNNFADNAGGGFHNGPGSWCLIQGNVISYNHTDGEAGGGIYAFSKSRVTVVDNEIISNRATLNGYGAGIWLWDNTGSLVERNIISGNHAEGSQGRGGGIGIIKGDVIVRNNLICGNQALRGGGIWIQNATTSQIVNNTIVGNRCLLTEGAGIGVAWSANPTITNNVLADNHPGGGIYATACSPLILFNNLWNHADGNYLGDLSDLTGVDGNISADPVFVDAGGWDNQGTPDPNDDVWNIGNYHIGYASGCRDAGQTSTLTPTDFDGNARPYYNAFDIGAYELMICDINVDGLLNVLDLAVMAESWLDTSPDLAADLNNDNRIDLEDFTILAHDWGN
ncbi:MAG: right-handed parallel beta-helix repeat-containing protein, partial [Sedimentisphaerales bacterium]|nr:right-handed parallel beta-helix repeat-containing protein [Sedimentisphaerales bacterium]